MTETTTVSIDEQVIELYKLLKLAGLAGSGGEAKALIADGQVSLNHVKETRKRKKVKPGDTVAAGGHMVSVVSANAASQN